MELHRSPLVITRKDGTVENSVFVRPDPTKPAEHLVHLSVLPSGHATVIDYDAHPHYHHDEPPHVVADKVKRFLEYGGHKMLGHPNSPITSDAEVARLKAKHGL
jgi:hypothetical protein